MAKTPSKPRIAAAFAAIIIAGGLSGCASLFPSRQVDCSLVKLQAESGRDDAEIAAAVGASVTEVALCRRTLEPETRPGAAMASAD